MLYRQEKVAETVRLCRLNLAVHGLSGEIKQGNTFYEDLHDSVGKFDYVMANPPFNVDKVDKERLKKDPRFPLGLPTIDNANYLYLQIFYSALNATGRAGFVMANSASDARGSELEVRRQLIEAGAVDVMIAVGLNMFYTVTLPCTLWFLDRGKVQTLHATSVLFIDARHIYRQMDRAHREFTDEQIDFIASLVRLYRGEDLNGYKFDPTVFNVSDSQIANLQSAFSNHQFKDVPGLCKVATLKEIEAQGWSLNPGRYVGVAEREADDFVFVEKLEELNEELEVLNAEARELEDRIGENGVKSVGATSVTSNGDRSQWMKVILRDICERVDYGYTASAKQEPVGPKFLRITDIVPDLIDWESVPYCEIPEKDLDKYRLQEGDIVMARTGATTGYAK